MGQRAILIHDNTNRTKDWNRTLKNEAKVFSFSFPTHALKEALTNIDVVILDKNLFGEDMSRSTEYQQIMKTYKNAIIVMTTSDFEPGDRAPHGYDILIDEKAISLGEIYKLFGGDGA